MGRRAIALAALWITLASACAATPRLTVLTEPTDGSTAGRSLDREPPPEDLAFAEAAHEEDEDTAEDPATDPPPPTPVAGEPGPSVDAAEPVLVDAAPFAPLGPPSLWCTALDELGFDAAPGSTAAVSGCGDVVVPEGRRCTNTWGSIPERPDLLVFASADDIGDLQLVEPDYAQIDAAVCVRENVNYSQVGQMLLPCGAASRDVDEPWLLDSAQTQLELTTEWFVYGAEQPSAATDQIVYGNCDRDSLAIDPTDERMGKERWMHNDDIDAQTHRIEAAVASHADLVAIIERIDPAGRLIADGPELPEPTCASLSAALDAFRQGLIYAESAFEFPLPWYDQSSQNGPMDISYAVRNREPGEEFDKLSEAAEAMSDLRSQLGDDPTGVWLDGALDQLVHFVAVDWPEILTTRLDSTSYPEIYGLIDDLPHDRPEFVRQLEYGGLVRQVREATTCTGIERRTDWINPDDVAFGFEAHWSWDRFQANGLDIPRIGGPVDGDECAVSTEINELLNEMQLMSASDWTEDADDGIYMKLLVGSWPSDEKAARLPRLLERQANECPTIVNHRGLAELSIIDPKQDYGTGTLYDVSKPGWTVIQEVGEKSTTWSVTNSRLNIATTLSFTVFDRMPETEHDLASVSIHITELVRALEAAVPGEEIVATDLDR